jgi:LuxR family transcriptional regulator, maltose regulon positive regulatory protein
VQRLLEKLLRQNQIGHVRPKYIKDILSAFSPTPPSRPESKPQPLIEPLSDREMDVLRLMAQGLKYKEIAAQLFISLNTVRYHVKAIYEKLAVNNRTQAIQKAQQLEIL